MNYFERFGLPLTLQIDADILRKRYYELSRAHHPDRFGLADSTERDTAIQQTAVINQGYQILSDPMLRLGHVLEIHAAMADGEKYALPPDFLAGMMEINESILEWKMDPEPDKLKSLQDELQKHEEACYSRVSHYFTDEALQLKPEDINRLKNYYFEHKYLQRVRENLEAQG